MSKEQRATVEREFGRRIDVANRMLAVIETEAKQLSTAAEKEVRAPGAHLSSGAQPGDFARTGGRERLFQELLQLHRCSEAGGEKLEGKAAQSLMAAKRTELKCADESAARRQWRCHEDEGRAQRFIASTQSSCGTAVRGSR